MSAKKKGFMVNERGMSYTKIERLMKEPVIEPPSTNGPMDESIDLSSKPSR